MFDKVKVKEAKKSLIELLTFVVESTKSQYGFGYAAEADLLKLHKAEPTFLTIDATVKNQNGDVKVTATQAAIDALAAHVPAAAPVEDKPKPEAMNLDMGFLDEIPPVGRGGNYKADSYPFDKLVAPTKDGEKMKYAFFFVPATEAKPNPLKFLSSTVASANKRHAKTDKAQYTVRKRLDAAGKVDGANVIRVA